MAKVVDIKIVFLCRELEEEIYIECSHATTNISKDDCVILQMCICGLVQAVGECNKNAAEILTEGYIDLSLLMKQSMKGEQVALCVDDNLMVCNSEAIDEAVELLQKNGLALKFINGLWDYLSCKKDLTG